jgi:hypothetical protein
MKKLFVLIAITFSLSASAQLADSTAYKDSVLNSYANNLMPLKLPVKAIALYAYYFSRDFKWANRLAPDAYKVLIGSGTKPDSLVNVSLTAKNITEFAQNLQGERYGAVYNYARSIFENTPAIPGYTSLITQLLTLGITGTPDQKNGFTYVNTKYGAYSTNLTDMINQYYTQGIYWIQH